jgi:hypothetical protein
MMRANRVMRMWLGIALPHGLDKPQTFANKLHFIVDFGAQRPVTMRP